MKQKLLSHYYNTTMQEKQPSFLCQLTGEILDDPVWGADGNTYERSAITNLLKSTSTTTNNPSLHSLFSTQPPTDAPQLQRVIQKLLFLVERPFSEQVAEGVVDDELKIQLKLAHVTRDACISMKTETKNNMDQRNKEREAMLQNNTLDAIRKKIALQEEKVEQHIKALEQKRQKLCRRHETISKYDTNLDQYEKQVWSIVNVQSKEHYKGDDRYQSLQRQVDVLRERVEKLKRTNISNETFLIWHEGAFGIINGFRLGRLPNIQVEWSEVNAAWGQAALLLATIAGKLGFTFQHFRVIPMGSYSKIAKIGQERHHNSYDLSTTTGNFGLFSRSTFNAGMAAFLVCLSELCDDAMKYDRALRLPYDMSPEKGEMIHNGIGVSIKLYGSTEEKWTKACKYMLTNLKYLHAWSTKTWRR